MKMDKRMALAMALGGLPFGCGDDDAPADGGIDSTGSDTGPAGSTSSTTEMVDDTGTTEVASASASGTDSSSSSSSGEPPPVEVTAEGEVVDFTAMGTPIADAAISLYDDPGIMATSDARGLFSIGPLMADTTALFVVAPSMDYWGAIIPIEIGSDELQEDVQLAQIPSSFVDFQIMLLEPQMPAMPDLDQAIVIVRLINNTAVAEGPTTIDMTPAPADGTYYAPDMSGAPILNQNTIEFSALPVVVYFNVADAAPGDITIDATHPTRDCTVLFPEFPVLGQHITLVDISCVP